MKKNVWIPIIGAISVIGCTSEKVGEEQQSQMDANAISVNAFVPKMQKSGDATVTVLESGINVKDIKTGKHIQVLRLSIM